MTPERLTRLIGEGDIYFKLASLLPRSQPQHCRREEDWLHSIAMDDTVKALRVVLAGTVLGAMEERLEFLASKIERSCATWCADHAPYGIVMFTGDGRCVYSNERARDLLYGGSTTRDASASSDDELQSFRRYYTHTRRSRSQQGDGAPEVDVLGATLTVPELREPIAFMFMIASNITEPLHTSVHLSPRERTVLSKMLAGYSNKDTAAELGVGVETVKTYVRQLFRKFDAHSKAELVRKTLIAIPRLPPEVAR